MVTEIAQIDVKPGMESEFEAGVGKASFEEKAIADNVRALIDSVVKAKPAGAKGHYVKRISISSTMGPGVKIALDSVGQAGAM